MLFSSDITLYLKWSSAYRLNEKSGRRINKKNKKVKISGKVLILRPALLENSLSNIILSKAQQGIVLPNHYPKNIVHFVIYI
jgi:hypothetical protein